jgi:ATP-binding cassette subfamily C protein EexD
MMTMRPATRKKAETTADDRAERMRIAREKQEKQRLSARKTAREAALEASRKEARAQVLAKKAAAREEARKARSGTQQSAAAPRPKRSDPPKLRVVEGSAGRRQGGV